MKIFGRIKRFFARKGVKIAAFFVIGFLLIFGLFRLFLGKEIILAKTYYIARNQTWAPLDLMGKEPYVTAFTTDVLTEIATRRKLQIAFITQENSNLFPGLDSGEYDAILIDVLPNSFMREMYDLSNPLFFTGPVLIVPSNSTVTSLEELQGKGGIGVHRGSQNIFKLGQDAKLTFVPYDSMTQAFDDLIQSVLVGVVMDNAMAHIFLEQFYKGRLKIATSPLTDEGVRLITLWDSHGEYLIEQFNQGLKEIREDGTFKSLVEKWTLFSD